MLRAVEMPSTMTPKFLPIIRRQAEEKRKSERHTKSCDSHAEIRWLLATNVIQAATYARNVMYPNVNAASPNGLFPGE